MSDDLKLACYATDRRSHSVGYVHQRFRNSRIIKQNPPQITWQNLLVTFTRLSLNSRTADPCRVCQSCGAGLE